MMPNQGVHESVEGDVREMLEGKTRVELEELEATSSDSWRRARRASTGSPFSSVKVHKARTWVDDVDAGLRSKRAALAPRTCPRPRWPAAAKDGPKLPADDSDDEDLLGARLWQSRRGRRERLRLRKR